MTDTFVPETDFCSWQGRFFGLIVTVCSNPATVEVDGKGWCPLHAEEAKGRAA